MSSSVLRWRTNKPSHNINVRVDPSAPLAHRLLWMTLANTPVAARDLIGRFHLPILGGATLDATPAGIGLRTDVGNERAQETAPDYLKLSSGTLIWRGVVLGASVQYAPIVTMSFSNSGSTAPYVSYGMFRDTDSTILLALFNYGFGLVTIYGGGIVYNQIEEYALSFKSGDINLYRNGVYLSNHAATGASPDYSSTSQLGIGRHADQNINSNIITDGVWIYSKPMTSTEIRQHYYAPYSMLRPLLSTRRVSVQISGSWYSFTGVATQGQSVLVPRLVSSQRVGAQAQVASRQIAASRSLLSTQSNIATRTILSSLSKVGVQAQSASKSVLIVALRSGAQAQSASRAENLAISRSAVQAQTSQRIVSQTRQTIALQEQSALSAKEVVSVRACVQSTSAVLSRIINKIVHSSQSAAATFTHAQSVVRSAVQGQIGAVAKSVAVIRLATQSVSAVADLIQSGLSRSFSTTQGTTATVSKVTSVTKASVQTTVAMRTSLTTKVFSSIQTSLATLSALVAQSLTVLATQAQGSLRTIEVRRNVLATTTQQATLSRSLSVVRLAQQVQLAMRSRILSKTLVALQSLVALFTSSLGGQVNVRTQHFTTYRLEVLFDTLSVAPPTFTTYETL